MTQSLFNAVTQNLTINRLSQFLIDSPYKPLQIVGKAMQTFGVAATISFFLGALCLHGYALIWGLPGFSLPKEIKLYGKIRTTNNEPLKEGFRVIVLDSSRSEFGPFQHDDGSFQVQVQSNSMNQYRMLIVSEDNQDLMLSPTLEVVEVHGRYEFRTNIVVPSAWGKGSDRITE